MGPHIFLGVRCGDAEREGAASTADLVCVHPAGTTASSATTLGPPADATVTEAPLRRSCRVAHLLNDSSACVAPAPAVKLKLCEGLFGLRDPEKISVCEP
jgi:hypothetical protein